ncbi:uncharacterized protein LOC121761326 isoform X2 [Salvia splendens]|uniref:uncharacterized protein LOC121761326 isoform X2 n=1 Tax=Salvia splendens TaxID=180675 RepID=UPI001C269F18|nr:uncharacterized protein LOC121761326 isoform X2 [Salvia splendens]
MEKGSTRKPPLPPRRRQRMEEKASAAARKPPLPPRRQRVDEKGSAAARNPPLPLRRKRKSGETPNRSWVADQLRLRDRYVKISSKISVSMAALSLLKDGHLRIWFPFFRDFALLLLSLCKVDGNLWADRLAQHLIQYIGMKLQSSTKQPDADADADGDDASPSKKLKGS